MGNGIFTYYADMPSTVHSFVVENSDLSFTIVINSKINHEQQLIAYQHEINHIMNGDYDKQCHVDLIEMAAHAINGTRKKKLQGKIIDKL